MSSFRRSIGLGGAVATLLGFVIGASIFVLPGTLAASAGPAVVLAYAVAGLLALLAALVAAQIGSALHVSGATYVAISRAISPLAGFVQVWVLLLAVSVAVPLIALAFADFLAVFVPVPRVPTAVALTLLLGLANVAPAKLVARSQVLLTFPLVLALALFGLGGLGHLQGALLAPFVPNGWGPVAAAVVPAYFSFAGLITISELSEEVRDPGRTIPRALAISFVVIFVTYLLVALVVPGVLPWRSLAGDPAPVARAARTFLPAAIAPLVPLGAMLKSAASINGLLFTQARDLFALGRDGVLPRSLARVSPRSGAPVVAVLVVTVLGTLFVFAGATLAEYAIVSVLGILVMQLLAGVALIRLPGVFPAAAASAPFRLSPAARTASGVSLAASSAAVAVVSAVAYPRATLVFAVLTALAFVYYAIRRPTLAALDPLSAAPAPATEGR